MDKPLFYWIEHKYQTPSPTEDRVFWANWFEQFDRTIKRTQVGEVVVSTVFLGIDHNLCEEGEPLLWETLVFGGKLQDEMKRYTSLASAEMGHKEMVERVRKAEGL